MPTFNTPEDFVSDCDFSGPSGASWYVRDLQLFELLRYLVQRDRRPSDVVGAGRPDVSGTSPARISTLDGEPHLLPDPSRHRRSLGPHRPREFWRSSRSRRPAPPLPHADAGRRPLSGAADAYRGYNTWEDTHAVLGQAGEGHQVRGVLRLLPCTTSTPRSRPTATRARTSPPSRTRLHATPARPTWRRTGATPSPGASAGSPGAASSRGGRRASRRAAAQVTFATCDPLSDPDPGQSEWTLTDGMISNGSTCLVGSSAGAVSLAACDPTSEAPAVDLPHQRADPRARRDLLRPRATRCRSPGARRPPRQSMGTSIAPQQWTVWNGAQRLASSYFGDADGYASDVSYYGSIRLGDVDGDGKADVCGRGSAGVWCALSQGQGSFGPPVLVPFGSQMPMPMFTDDQGWKAREYGATLELADIDGDGKADVCARGPDGVMCVRSTSTPGSPSFGTSALWSAALSDAEGWAAAASYYGSIRLGDVDGDGKADLCARGITGLWCALQHRQLVRHQREPRLLPRPPRVGCPTRTARPSSSVTSTATAGRTPAPGAPAGSGAPSRSRPRHRSRPRGRSP